MKERLRETDHRSFFEKLARNVGRGFAAFLIISAVNAYLARPEGKSSESPAAATYFEAPPVTVVYSTAGSEAAKAPTILTSPEVELSPTETGESSEPKITEGCLKRDCDTTNFNPGRLVCIEGWQKPDGSTYEKVGVATGETCRSLKKAEVIGFEKINSFRVEGDRLPLAHSRILTTAAEERVEQMINTGRFSHTSPDGKILLFEVLGGMPNTPSVSRCGEILGRTNADLDEEAISFLMAAFRWSQGHYEVIMDNNSLTLGFAAKRDSGGMMYVAGVFCRSSVY